MKFLYLFISIFFSMLFKTQLLKVEYNLIRNTTIRKENDFSQEFKKKVLEDEKKAEKYVLYYTNGESFFKSNPRSLIEYENAPETIGETRKTLIERAEKQPVKIYKIKGKDHFYAYCNVDGDQFYKVIDANSDHKNYKNETQMIDKFTCKLVEITATSGKKIKVWYTEEIPISTGPFAYTNFPGVVLKVEHPTFVIFATKISKEVKKGDLEKMNPKYRIKE